MIHEEEENNIREGQSDVVELLLDSLNARNTVFDFFLVQPLHDWHDRMSGVLGVMTVLASVRGQGGKVRHLSRVIFGLLDSLFLKAEGNISIFGNLIDFFVNEIILIGNFQFSKDDVLYLLDILFCSTGSILVGREYHIRQLRISNPEFTLSLFSIFEFCFKALYSKF
jgi:hypothetical protein